jgi:UDP-GlcNAc:undecaprenyl-phosphate GlcNAc-1-phosphate transferase
MLTHGFSFLLSLVTAAVLTPLVRTLALRQGLLDHAISERKIHGAPIPRLGGIAIFCAFHAPFFVLLLDRNPVSGALYADLDRVLAVLVGGICITLLGVYDDLRGSGAAKKFAVQFAVAGLTYYFGFRIDQVTNPFGEPLELGVLGLPVTLLWIVGVINAMNLIDGLDGLAAGVAVFAAVANFVIALDRGDPLMLTVSASLAGAILGFLVYNFYPATIFMGDSGSMFLGFVLATTAIQTNQKASTTVALLIPIVMLGLPILDTLLAIARRAASGRSLFRADREHIHHRMLSLGLTQRQATLYLYALCLFLGLSALALTVANSTQAALLLSGVAGVGYLLVRKLGYTRLMLQRGPDVEETVAPEPVKEEVARPSARRA